MSANRPLCLVDTNVLIRFADSADPYHPAARSAVEGERERHDLRVLAQNLVEFWNVMTRPQTRNGFGHSIEQASRQLGWIEELFPRVPDPPDLYERWRTLVVQFGVSGSQVHDARIVAAMQSLGITKILTFNGQDFSRYAPLGVDAQVRFKAETQP